MDHLSPVYPKPFADPFVWQYKGCYYAVGTSPAGADGQFALLRSDDLASWESLGHALVPVAAEFGEDYWAPEVAFHEGLFYLYYSVGHGDKGHHIRVAVSKRPEGPYTDTGSPLTDLSQLPFAIDGSPFRDDDGQWYLFYARDFLDCEDGLRAGTGIVVDRLIDMRRLAGEERLVARARYDWQMYMANRPMYEGVYDWHTLEGPAVRKHDSRYYCFYSGGCFQNDTYGVDYVVADDVIGPYCRVNGAARVLRSIPDRLIGPGHNSIVTGPDGKTDYIVYHAWDQAHTARRMHICELAWEPDGPKAVIPPC